MTQYNSCSGVTQMYTTSLTCDTEITLNGRSKKQLLGGKKDVDLIKPPKQNNDAKFRIWEARIHKKKDSSPAWSEFWREYSAATQEISRISEGIMVGAIVSTSSIADTQHPSPRFCINPNCDSYRLSRFCFRASGEVGFCRSLQGRRQLRLSSRAANGVSRKRQKVRKFVVFGELKGQTDDSFNDVKDVSRLFLCCHFVKVHVFCTVISVLSVWI